MTHSQELMQTFQALDLWLQSKCGKTARNGINSWYSENMSDGGYPYPEIAGYFLTYESWRGRSNKKESHDTAQWLSHDEDSIRIARDIEPNTEYVFDAGIIAAGILSFAEKTGEVRYQNIGKRILEPIIDNLLTKGSIHPILSGSYNRRRTWSTDARAHLVKIVQALLKTGTSQAEQAAAILVKLVVHTLQNNDLNEFRNADGRLYLHPMLYTVEGLWIWASATDDQAALTLAKNLYRRAESIIIKSARLESEDAGGAGNVAWKQGDVLAQLYRLSGLLQMAMKQPSLIDNVELIPSSEGTAVSYGYGLQHQNTWATMFYSQAIACQKSSSMTVTWKDLV